MTYCISRRVIVPLLAAFTSAAAAPKPTQMVSLSKRVGYQTSFSCTQFLSRQKSSACPRH